MKNNSKEIVLELYLPEFKRKDIKIKVSNTSISIKAKKNVRNQIQKRDFSHKELSERIFNYSTSIPRIDPKKAEITFKKGMLLIKAPKK